MGMDAITYRTVGGEVLDLTGLDEAQAGYLATCRAALEGGMDWTAFSRLVDGDANPLLGPTGGVITRAVYAHPLFRAVRDMEDRLGVAQGKLRATPETDYASDPFADEWISTSEAVARKGVSLVGLHKAIARGSVIAHPAREGGKWLRVSANSLAAWKLSPGRQAASHHRTVTRRPLGTD